MIFIKFINTQIVISNFTLTKDIDDILILNTIGINYNG